MAGALTNWFLPNNRNKYFQLTEILATKVFKLKAYFWNKYFRRKTFTSIDEIRVIPLGSGIVVLSLKHFFLCPHPHPEHLPLLPASFLASSFLGKVKCVKLEWGKEASEWFTAKSLCFHSAGYPDLDWSPGSTPSWSVFWAELFVKWGSSVCFVAVNTTLRTWRVYVDQHCPVELPMLMDWSISAPSNTVVTSPQNVATARRNWI